MTTTYKDHVFLVTGAGGFFGARLCKELLKREAKAVHGFDLRRSPFLQDDAFNDPRFKFFGGDIRNYEDVKSAASGGVTAVFHIASYGMSGREMLKKQMVYDVNVKGTEHVIRACTEMDISALVYTSTVNVVFSGKPLEFVDETFPVLAPHEYMDEYSKTKGMAEQKVIKANKTTTKSGKTLYTCSVRPGGIYGEGEVRHQARVIEMVSGNMYLCTFGDPNSKVEWVYVDNLVFAEVLAFEKLVPGKSSTDPVAAGQCYYITDGEPVNQFEFFRPLVEGLGYKVPTTSVPLGIVLVIAFITEILHSIVRYVYDFQPLLTRMEVLKCCVTHCFSIEKAKKELGYKPIVSMKEGMERVVKHSKIEFEKMQQMKKKNSGGFGWLWWAMLMLVVMVLFQYLFK